MVKKIIKELIIALLLCLAIILVLGIVLYNYNPSSKTLPDKVEYTTSQTVKEYINDNQGVDEDKIVMTYSVDSTDLNNYRRVHSYVPGKNNPFSSYKNTEVQGTNTTTSGTSTSTGTTTNPTNSNTSTTANTSSEGTYLPNRGTK